MIGKRCPTFEKKVVAFEKDEFSRTWLAKPKVINIKTTIAISLESKLYTLYTIYNVCISKLPMINRLLLGKRPHIANPIFQQAMCSPPPPPSPPYPL
jgi:hypothetical protein